jgi:hypothetical protein
MAKENRKRTCPVHGRQPGDKIAAGVNCNGKSAACPAKCTATNPADHQGETCPVHEKDD